MLSQMSRLLLPLTLLVSSFYLVADAADAPPSPGDYRLGPQDQVRVKVFEWRPVRDEIFEWKALNDQYVVGASGNVSLPMIGEINASGLTTHELARSIGERMIAGIGLVEMPTISVEIIKFRPFYINGRVQAPGEYPYRPNLTVMQAFSIAGGLRRSEGGFRIDREIIAGQGDVELLAQERSTLLARRARIEADLRDLPEIMFPIELQQASDPATKLLMEQEKSILAAFRQAFNSQIEPLEKLKLHLNNEVTSIEAQTKNHDEKAKLATSELADVETLIQRRLTTQPRRLAAKRNVFELDGSKLQLDIQLMRVRQEISKADFAISELRSKHTNDATTELRLTQEKLDAVNNKFEIARRLLLNSAETDDEVAGNTLKKGTRLETVFKIMRITGDGQAVELTASDSTAVQPGDTIKVEVRSIDAPTEVTQQDPRG